MTIPLRTPLPNAPLDEADLGRVVDAFYDRVRADPVIGPVFNDAIHDWPAHLDNLKDFWSSVMFTTGRYKGRPMPAHVRHAARIDDAAFERWLMLWRETTDALVAPVAAAALQEKAAKIAQSLAMGIDFYKAKLAGETRRAP